MTERNEILTLAATAIQAAKRDQWAGATRAVEAISNQYGGSGLSLAILGWCDMVAATTPQARTAKAVRLRWVEVDGPGTAEPADGVPPEVRWAGQLLAARATLDKPTFDALMNALPQDGAEIGEHVMALVSMVALNSPSQSPEGPSHE